MTNWKRTLGQKLCGVTAEKAKELIAAKLNDGNGIGSQTIRDLTGGFSSQAIDTYVLRKLGIKAGIIRPIN